MELALDLLDQLRALLVNVVLRVEELAALGVPLRLQRLDLLLRLELFREGDRRLRRLLRRLDERVEFAQLALDPA